MERANMAQKTQGRRSRAARSTAQGLGWSQSADHRLCTGKRDRTSQTPEAKVVQSRELRFKDRSDGGVSVYEGGTDRIVDVLAPGTNGFVRGVMRAFARERRREDVGPQPPFLLTRWSDGRLSIEDVATRERIELIAFGQTNFAAFARLLNDRSASR